MLPTGLMGKYIKGGKKLPGINSCFLQLYGSKFTK